MEYLEENKIITISLGNKVKEKIKNKFNRDIEEFIEKEFPQDEELKIFIFKHKSKDKNKIGIKINDSDYILFVERSIDNLRNKIDNYMFCFDIQKNLK